MSTSIAIPGFVSERKNEILELTKLGSQRREVSKKRQRITMYRTRSYISYSMSRAARQKHKKRPLLFAIKVKPKILYRQHRRIPRLLLNSFASMTTIESSADNNTPSCIQSFDKKKKKKIEIGTSLTTTQSDNQFNRLNTHIWHVKRFFMMKKYGWRIPTHNRSKGLKSIDSLLNQCVLEDISYYLAGKNVSLEDDSSTVPPVACSSMSLQGSIEAISDLLYEFMDPSYQLFEVTDDDVPVLQEIIEKEIILYQHDRFPAGAIGPVALLLIPGSCCNSGNSIQVNISCHPAIYTEVYNQLYNASTHEQYANICTLQTTIPKYNRFRLRGEWSSHALLSILQAPNTDNTHKNEENIQNMAYLHTLLDVKCISKHCKEGDCFAVDIQDPRISATPTTTATTTATTTVSQCMSQMQSKNILNQRPKELSMHAYLFQPCTVYDFHSDHQRNTEKHQNKVHTWEAMFTTTTPFACNNTTTSSSSDKNSTDKENNLYISDTMCPILLIRKEAVAQQRLGIQQRSLSGWDVLVPAVWGRTIFTTLQQQGGAVVVGSTEMAHLQAKSGVPCFPADFIDTTAGRSYWSEQQKQCIITETKRPPYKQRLLSSLPALLLQCNSTNITSKTVDNTIPSIPNATQIVDINEESFKNITIIRGEQYLKDFRPPVYEDLDTAHIEETNANIAAAVVEDSTYIWASPYIPLLPSLPALMFLQVLLVPTSGGLIHELSELISPTPEDVQNFVKHKLNFQQKRKAAVSAKLASQSKDLWGNTHNIVKHSGLYKHTADDTTTAESAVCIVDPELSKEWSGVRLTQRRRVCTSISPPGDSLMSAGNIATTGNTTTTPTELMMEVVAEVHTTTVTTGTTAHTTATSTNLPAQSKKTNKNKKSKGRVCEKNGASSHSNSTTVTHFDYTLDKSDNRHIIGTITTGQKEHLNNTHYAVGICHVNLLNKVFSQSYGRYCHPQAHNMILYRNPRSDRLLPAVIVII